MVWLLLTLPGIVYLAAGLGRPLRFDRTLYLLLVPVLAAALWIVAVGLAARWTASFEMGLWIGMPALAVLSLAFRRRGPSPDVETPRPSPSRWMLASALLTVIPIAVMAFGADFYDEEVPNGHLSILGQIANGEFPPSNVYFPDLPLRYHYGFDLVAAAGTALGHLPIPRAIDVTTVACWILAWCLAWLLGDRLAGRGTGGWTALGALLGGGALPLVALFSDAARGSFVERVADSAVKVAGVNLNPPVVSYFFQKPFAMGIPLALAVLLVAREPAERWGRRRHLLLAVLLAALSLVQAVLFLGLLATLLVTELRERRFAFAAFAAGTLATAVALGGLLFTPLAEGAEMGLRFQLWILHASPGEVLLWHAASLGALLPVGAWGFFLVPRRHRLFTALFVGGNLAVPLLVTYEQTWDIVKFVTVAALALGFLAGLVLAQLSARRSFGARLGLAALLVAVTAGGVIDMTCRTWWSTELVTIPESPEDDAAAGWLQEHAAAGELVYLRRDRHHQIYYMRRGLHLAGPVDMKALAFGAPRPRIDARHELLLRKPQDLKPYVEAGIRWLVLEQGDSTLGRRAAAWEETGDARRLAAFGPLTIYRLGRR